MRTVFKKISLISWGGGGEVDILFAIFKNVCQLCPRCDIHMSVAYSSVSFLKAP